MDHNEKTELIFVPFSSVGHLAVSIELARIMTLRDSRLTITVIIFKFPFFSRPTAVSDSIRLVTLPPVEIAARTPDLAYLYDLMKAQVPLVRDAVRDIARSGSSARLGGLVLDMFSVPMMDVAAEFGVPSYLFFTCPAGYLGFMLRIQSLRDNEGLDFGEFKGSDAELEVPCFANPVPAKVFPPATLEQGSRRAEALVELARRFRRVKGIMVNTFVELEPHAVRSFSDGALPKVYPVGPILAEPLEPGVGEEGEATAATMRWLDDQPPSSVIFLCFGSRGIFGADQVREIAHALERSGHRFLWSLRRPPPTKTGSPADPEGLPEGFLNRTAKTGKVIGWAPQVAVLAHPAVGGFVSHCGWNSTLESISNGVPVAAWPLMAEQQLNAFEMVKELGLAVEIKMDFYMDRDCFVSSEEIEMGLKKLMDEEGEVRKKMKEMKEVGKTVTMAGGSSHFFLGQFMDDVMTPTQF